MDSTCIPQGSIVVGVDGSQAGARAVDWAADEAALEGRPLVLVHAIGSLGTPGTVWLTESDRLVTEMRAGGEAILGAASERVMERHPAVDVYQAVVAADPRQALFASAERAEMVVVGSRGRGPVRSLLLGSVSAAVARHAPCPVVVVRPHHPGAVRQGVLVGADGTQRSIAALEFAYGQASARDLPLTVMHCVLDPVPEDAQLLLAESTAGLAEKYPDVHVTVVVSKGLPEPCLELTSQRMDLLVVGRRHASTVSHVLSGDVGMHVVEHGRTVVALVPETAGPTNPGNGTSAPDLRPAERER